MLSCILEDMSRKKVLSYHSGSCDICKSLGRKIIGAKKLEEMEWQDIFPWRKKYDDDCSLYSPSEGKQDFVKAVTLFCHVKHLHKAKILMSITSLALKHAEYINFCTPAIQGNAVSLTVHTFLYEVKWANSFVNSDKNSKRKLQILKLE